MISEQLKKIRQAQGISQNELAKRADVPQCLISRIEGGRQDMHLSTARKLLRALGYDLVISIFTPNEGGEKISS